MTCSMSRKGNCSDNPPTESWFNSFKNERVHGLRYETCAEMTAMSLEYRSGIGGGAMILDKYLRNEKR